MFRSFRTYRAWVEYRPDLVEFDGRRIFLPFLVMELAVGALAWLPQAERVLGISSWTATALVGVHIAGIAIASFPLFRLAQRHRWAFHVMAAFSIAYNVGVWWVRGSDYSRVRISGPRDGRAGCPAGRGRCVTH